MTARYPKPGTVLLGKYGVESLIGEGGMGAVLRARHLDLEETVAIKVLLPEHMDRADIVARFLREAKASVKLKGEHVARVLDVGRLDDAYHGSPYIVMEYLDGADLNAIIKHHGAQLPPIAADLILQACEAIAEAHALGIIHRDIKASNFFITQAEDQPPHLKVLDFGIATAPQGTSDLTSTQSVIGTPAYMAPEQMRASRTADARSDIWSMGVVLYELLEAARPFRSTVYSDLCLQVGMDPPVPMTMPVPDALQLIVLKCLEKNVEDRYQTVAELAFDLMPFASDPVLARAQVEAIARALGRRGMRVFDAARAPDDVTPPPMTPPKLTPSEISAQDLDDSLATRLQTRRSSLTPVPAAPIHKTPTSINASNGEVSAVAPVSHRARNMLVALGFVATAALGAAIVFMVAPAGKDSAAAIAPVAPAPEPVKLPAKPEPVRVERVEALQAAPAKPEAAKIEPTVPAKTEPTVPAKTVPAKPEPAKVKPPVRVVKQPPARVVKPTTPPISPKDPIKSDPHPSDDDVYKVRQ